MNDFLLDAKNDLLIKSGDLVINESEGQEIDMLLKSFKGEWKENPSIGAEVIRLINSRSTETKIKKAIYEELDNDGFREIDIKIIDYPNIEIDAKK